MPTQVDIPGVGLVEFPDSMDDAAITAASAKLHADSIQGPKQPEKSVSERAADNLNQNADWNGGVHVNTPMATRVGRAAVGAVQDTAPYAGSLLGGSVGFATGGPLGAAAGAALGNAGGKGIAQLGAHYLNPAEEKKPGEFARDTASSSINQALMGLILDRIGAGIGAPLGAGRTEAARETIAQAQRSNLDPNVFSYSEASGFPAGKVAQGYLDKRTLAGRLMSAQRGEAVRDAVDAAQAATKKEVSAPFEKAVEDAFQSGQQIDTGNIYGAAQQLQDRLGKEGTQLSSGAQKLLNRALQFGTRIGGNAPAGTYVSYRPGAEEAAPAVAQSVSRPATPYEIRGLRTEVSDGLSSSDPEVRRVAQALEESSRLADDQFLPEGTRQNYRNFKSDFSGKEGSIQKKLQVPTPNSEGHGFFHMIFSPLTNAAAVASNLLNKVPLEQKVRILEALKNGNAVDAIATAIRGAQLGNAISNVGASNGADLYGRP